MHFLCLHGLGTNSQILETQLASIRHELGDFHTFEYVEGCMPCPVAPAIAAFYPPDGKYFAYFSSDQPSSFVKALNDLEAYIDTEGPFDGVLGYSQGAQLVSSLLLRTHRCDPTRRLFRCAVLLSGGVPCEIDQTTHKVRHVEPSNCGIEIDIPTAHIWGINDDLYPEAGKVLSRFYRDDWSTVFVHKGGHEIPGVKSQQDLLGSVKAIRRAISRELTMQ
ncbi:hypothetical protein K461DRAFT_281412 [Myriangium duriaei CBS 260.36]|uniref:Serine hydrolase domain-containing protein n=1 Tax=Myriangium duriaei CBS 260.36 TaxID=1168546 RepID=A0A9P4IYR1_9PEZI|nr:hypothetical protein K461DRAFT_281412 [Myriangium duriaei CBS 260.36]